MSHKDLNIIPQFDSADKEEFKRPDHADFMSAFELKQAKWSGVRHNTITQEMEVWVLGEVKMTMADHVYAAHPEIWEQQYAELFGLNHVKIMKGA